MCVPPWFEVVARVLIRVLVPFSFSSDLQSSRFWSVSLAYGCLFFSLYLVGRLGATLMCRTSEGLR
jgi:hypothetical protein